MRNSWPVRLLGTLIAAASSGCGGQDAHGTTGDLYFLRADRMLTLDYLTSSTDLAGALRLAHLAVGRLGTLAQR